MIYPYFEEIQYQNPLQIFALFAQNDAVVLLESAKLMVGCGRYSYIALDPAVTLISKNSEMTLNGQKQIGDPFALLAKQLSSFQLECHPDMPLFQGGAAGFFSYDLYQHLETIVSLQQDDMEFPDMAVGFYDLVIGFDHVLQQAWIFSSGFPRQDASEREARAKMRCAWLKQKIINLPELTCCHVATKPVVTANFSALKYQAAVQQVKEYILAGDIFEANIAQRFRAVLAEGDTPFALYQRLRAINAAPFAAYLSFAGTTLVSASPERFLQLKQGQVESRPIKGTRPRGGTVVEDAAFADDLMNSAKDHAENVMIVDLLRNDLSRVCEDHSVSVPQLCGLESYASVHHLVSVVTGRLRAEYTAVDLLRASFPGGSITGAPKVRALEIIAEIEPTRRGPYCGSIGYIGFNGDMDTSITIRTFAVKNNVATFQAGGAVVMDSDPVAEYEETLMKAKLLREALG